jgi:hypothetical protein
MTTYKKPTLGEHLKGMKLPFEIREQSSFLYAKEIVKPFGVVDQVIEWCKHEMIAEWRWQLVEVSSDVRPGRYVFYFDSERDAVAFTLRWI